MQIYVKVLPIGTSGGTGRREKSLAQFHVFGKLKSSHPIRQKLDLVNLELEAGASDELLLQVS
jgi:hypothetical protein